jgi:TolB-like protein/Tfp pilus assembly protein PilF
MTEPVPEAEEAEPLSEAPAASVPPADLWERIKEHKVLQWSLTYFGASLALAHAQDLLSHTYHWPELAGRLLMGVLIVGFPVVVALAWYHGHKGLKQISAGELTVVSFLVVIGAGLLVVLIRVPIEPASPLQLREGIPPPATSVANEVNATSASAPETSPVPQVSVPQASIAVMPFVNLTGDAGKEYFSDGMAEELINLLAQVPGLKVPARTSSFAYKGRNIDVRRIAQDLGVATILEGSVRSAGQEIRVTAQLVNAQTGYHVWSKDYDRKLGDIFKLQDDLAGAIVQALRTNLNVSLPAATAQTAPTQDVEAYQLYLQSRSITLGAFGYSDPRERALQAIGLLDQALTRDPTFARALAWRAELRVAMVGNSWGAPPNTLKNAEQDARRALALSPNLADAHAALGYLYATQGKWSQAEASFRAALSADPADPTEHQLYADLVLSSVGRLKQALAEASEAYRLAPADQLALMALSGTNNLMGRDAEALRFAHMATEMGVQPDNLVPINATVAMRGGRYQQAGAYTAATLSPAVRSAGGAEAVRLFYWALSDPTKKPGALQALESLEHKLESGDMDPDFRQGWMALSFTMLGALDSAYRVVNRVIDENVPSGIGAGPPFLWLPEMRPFRKDPRFQALVTRIGLIDYWKQYGPPDDCALKDGKLTCR